MQLQYSFTYIYHLRTSTAIGCIRYEISGNFEKVRLIPCKFTRTGPLEMQ